MARVAGLALLVGACGPDLIVDGVALEGTQWRAITIAGVPPVVGHEPTLAFEGGPISGYSGCNDYSWTYTSLLGGAISVRGLSVADRACENGDRTLTMVEERLFAALRAAERIDVLENRLVISTKLGTLAFERVHGAGDPVR